MTSPQEVAEREITLFQANLGWWNIMIWPDIWTRSIIFRQAWLNCIQLPCYICGWTSQPFRFFFSCSSLEVSKASRASTQSRDEWRCQACNRTDHEGPVWLKLRIQRLGKTTKGDKCGHCICINMILGGGFEYFLFSPPKMGKMNPVWLIFSNGLVQPPTRISSPSACIRKRLDVWGQDFASQVEAAAARSGFQTSLHSLNLWWQRYCWWWFRNPAKPGDVENIPHYLHGFYTSQDFFHQQ